MAERQTRRRGAVLERAILDAAWGEVAEHGWSRFSVEGVAARTGTSKAVIYRRWRSRVELAEEMLRGAAAAATPALGSSGDLRTDLVTFLESMSAFLSGPFGSVARGVVCETSRPSQDSLFGGSRIVADVGEIVDRAVERGDLRGTPSALAVNVGHGLLMADFLQTGGVPGSDAIVELVDTVWLPALGATA